MDLTRANCVTLHCLQRTSQVLRHRERSNDPDDSTPATFDVITHPFFNTMFCTRMAAPQLLKLRDTENLWIDSPLQEWMDRIEGYKPDTRGVMVYNAHPDFLSTMARLKNILAVLAVACADQKHTRVVKELRAVLDVLCWTKYFMTKRRFLFPVDDDDGTLPPLIAFWRYADMQRVSETTAAEWSVKWVVNSMFTPREDGCAKDPLQDCADVYHYMLSRLSNWNMPTGEKSTDMPLSLFCYGMQAVLLRALYHYFPNIIGTDDYRETLSAYWSCKLHREIECTFQTRQMMVNQIDPAQLEGIARRLCKSDRKKRVVMQTYVPETFKGIAAIGILTTKLDVLQPNNGLAKGKTATVAAHNKRVPTQPKFYNACVYWRLLAEMWHPDTPVIQADWCTADRIQLICDIYAQAVQKSQVHGIAMTTVDKEVEPAVAKRVQRLTAKQMRDEQEDKLRDAQKRTKARLERRLHSSLAKQREKRCKEEDDADGVTTTTTTTTTVDSDDDTATTFPSFSSATEIVSSTLRKQTKVNTEAPAVVKRKRAPRTWVNARSPFHLRCVQLIQQIKFDVVQCLPYYARLVLACNSGSCHVEPPLDAASAHEQAMSNPEKLPLQTHARKKRKIFSETSLKKEHAEKKKKAAKQPVIVTPSSDISVVKKPPPTGPIRAFILHLFQTTVNDPVWREPILAHADAASALVLCRDKKTKAFKFAYSVPRDLNPWFSLRFTVLPPDLPVTATPRAYDALNPKGSDNGWRETLLRELNHGGDWGDWRCVMCTRKFIETEWKHDVKRFCVYDVTGDIMCVCPTHLALTRFELALLMHKPTFKRLASRDLITWYLVLNILFVNRMDVYQELRLIRPTLTPWSLERAYLQYDLAATKLAFGDGSDLIGNESELHFGMRPANFWAMRVEDQEVMLAKAWVASTSNHARILEYN